MYKTLGVIAVTALLMNGCGAEPKPVAKPIKIKTNETTSYFNNGSVDNWSLYLGKVQYKKSNSGYIKAIPDGDSATSYFVAPNKFFGDLSSKKMLKFDIWSSGGRYFTTGYKSFGDVVIKNGNKTATYNFTSRPSKKWESMEIPLTDNGQWTLSNGTESLNDVLKNVTKIFIRAEYGVGKDYAGLDNVIFQ